VQLIIEHISIIEAAKRNVLQHTMYTTS